MSSGFMSDFSKNGARSTKTWDAQNSPTLSVVKDDTTSGASEPPARRSWLIFSSVMPLVTSTWMFGFLASKSLTAALIAATSLGAVQPCQNLIVVSAFGLSLAPPLELPVHPAASRANTTTAVVPTAFRWSRGMVLISCVASASRAADRLAGLDGVKDFVPDGRQGHAEAALEDRSVGDAGQLDRRPGDGQLGQLRAHQVEQSVAARLEHAAGEHDQIRIEHRDDGGEAECDPMGECGQQLVPRARGRQSARHGQLGRTGSKAAFAGQLEHLGPAGQRLEPAGVAATHLPYDRCLRQRQEADLASAAGRTAVQGAVDDDGGAESVLGPQQDEAGVAAGPADVLLRDRGQVDVV